MDGDRVFELRTYRAQPGKLDALEARFAEHTIPLLEGHGLTLVGLWRAAGDEEVLVYLLAAESRAAAERSWAAFQADPAWIAAKAASERSEGGPLVATTDSLFLVPSGLSPLR